MNRKKLEIQEKLYRQCSRLYRYSFIDLAQIVCKLPETRNEKSYSSSSDEDYEGYISEPSMIVSGIVIHISYAHISKRIQYF